MGEVVDDLSNVNISTELYNKSEALIRTFKKAWEEDPIFTVYVNGTEKVYKILNLFKDILPILFPKDVDLFNKLLDTKSDSDFKKVLKDSGYSSKYIGIQEVSEGVDTVYDWV